MPKNAGTDKIFGEITADLENFLAVRDICKEGNGEFTYRNAFFTPYIKRNFIGKDENCQGRVYRIDTQGILRGREVSIKTGG
ncbi:MAG: hypothetical protein LBD71_07890 [Treponema sp.]|nr:hypothetical protein [Treponema sp.]